MKLSKQEKTFYDRRKDPIEQAMQLDRAVAIPTKVYQRMKYPLRVMEVGESFFVPGAESKKRASLRSTMSIGAKKCGIKITSRTVLEDKQLGVRFWRTK